MKLTTSLALASTLAIASAASDSASTGKVLFSGVGYDFSYNPLGKIQDSKDQCSCELSDKTVWSTGPNAPFSENLAVHVRGPLKLSKFSFYTSSNFTIGANSSDNWNRSAYFDNTGDSEVHENVTFLGMVGNDTDCLGKKLSYVGQDGQSVEKQNTAPGRYMQPTSDVEYVLFSNVSCPKSSVKGGCGVYRDDIPAFYGYGGVTTMFLFEFSMPDDVFKSNDTSEFNAPSIWLSSDSLPRVTSKYGLDNNCSCLFQGCGGFEVFSANSSVMYSSIMSLQGVADVNAKNAMSALFNNEGNGYFDRPKNSSVTGGIIFDTTGNVATFISDNIKFDAELTASSVNSILSGLEQLGTTKVLEAGTQAAPTSSAKHNAGNVIAPTTGMWLFLSTIFIATAQYLF